MEEKVKTTRTKKILALAAVAAAIIIMGLAFWLVGVPLVRYVGEPENFRLWVDSHGVAGRLAYTAMVFFQVVIAVIPGEPFEILGGYAFGALEGTILFVLASTAGSITVFALVRRFGTVLVEAFFSREKLQALRFLKNAAGRDILYLVIFMIPGTPKDLLSYFAGLTDIGFPSWLLICSLGRIPSVITSTIGGSAMGSESYGLAAAVFAGTLLISAGGIIAYRHICKKRNDSSKTE